MTNDGVNGGFRWGRILGLVVALVLAALSGLGDKFFAHAENGVWLVSFVFFLGGYVLCLPFFVMFRSQEKLTLGEAIEEAKRIFGSDVKATRNEEGKNVFPDELKTLVFSLVLYYLVASWGGNMLVELLNITVLGS